MSAAPESLEQPVGVAPLYVVTVPEEDPVSSAVLAGTDMIREVSNGIKSLDLMKKVGIEVTEEDRKFFGKEYTDGMIAAMSLARRLDLALPHRDEDSYFNHMLVNASRQQ